MTNPMLEQFSGSSTIMIDLGDETAEVGEGATLDEEDNEQDVLQRNWHIELINSQVASHVVIINVAWKITYNFSNKKRVPDILKHNLDLIILMSFIILMFLRGIEHNIEPTVYVVRDFSLSHCLSFSNIVLQ